MKKALTIVKSIFVWTIVVLAVLMMVFTVISVSTFDRDDREIFGYKMFIVKSDSMSKTHFEAGDLIFVKEVNETTLKEGDVITFTSMDNKSRGEIITHMIRREAVDAQGNRGFVTYGTTTGVDDETVVTYPYIKGKYVGKLPNVGTFFNFLKTPQGYIVCILVPFMIIIIYQGVKCIMLFRRYKKEQSAELEAERARIEAERAESQRVLEELKALKEQLAANDGDGSAEAAVADTENGD